MLRELLALHDATYLALRDMEELCKARAPDRSSLASARWKLTSGTVKRLRLIELEIYPAILPTASLVERTQLEHLAAERQERRQASADHVARWSLERAVTEWEGYKKASVTIRSGALARLNRERETLVPMLDRLEQVSLGFRTNTAGR